MSLRVELHARLTVSNDNTPAPIDLVFQSGDKSLVDTSSYALGVGKVLALPASTVNAQASLDGITSVGVLFALAEGSQVSVTLVPTGKTLGDCSALKMLPNVPLAVGSDIAAVYFSNADTGNSTKVHFGFAGN